MSRCPQCGMKECCGGDFAPEVYKLEAELAEALELLKNASFISTRKPMAAQYWADRRDRFLRENIENRVSDE